MSKKKAKKIKFGISLTKAALQELDFLKIVDAHPLLHGGPLVNQAIQRYENLWLPLSAEFSGYLTAPLDIEWIWYCHMLCPTAYEADCIKFFGHTVDHQLIKGSDYHRALDRSKVIWLQKYPDQKFVVDLDRLPEDEGWGHRPSRLSYDIAAAISRQKVFYYQVSLPHYRDELFLEKAVLRYQKFLLLKKLNPQLFIVPCYDVDLIWHAHQAHPCTYKTDTVKVLGKLFNHDDTTTDRSPESHLTKSDKETRKIWKETYKEHFSNYGSMYRGEPPRGKLYPVSPGDCYRFSSKQVEIMTNHIKIHGTNPEIKYTLSIMKNSALQGNKLGIKIRRLTSNSEGVSSKPFVFDTKSHDSLTISLVRKTGFACFSSKSVLNSFQFALKSVIEQNDTATGQTLELHSEGRNADSVTFSLNLNFRAPARGLCTLKLESGNYESAVIPEHMWGPVYLPSLPPGQVNNCTVASHRLLNHMDQVTFTCRVVHSLPLMMSIIQVFYHDKMAAVGHLVGSDQIPLPNQVTNSCPTVTLNPRQGERAVLIKNHNGDWGICKGRWTGFRKGKAGTKGRRGIRGSPGYLEIVFYKFSTGMSQTLSLVSYLKDNFAFQFSNVFVDLMKGEINVNTNTNEVAENLVLAFAVALLHVMCVPRPSDWKEGKSLKPQSSTRGTKQVTAIPSEAMALVLACGLMWNTPSNHFIYHTYGNHACAGCGGDTTGVCDYGDVATTLDAGDGGDIGDTGACGGGCGGGGCGGG